MLRHLTLYAVATLALLGLFASTASADPKLKALIVDGQNNHNWVGTTPLIQQILLDTGLFQVDISTTPPAKGADLADKWKAWHPKFSDYGVVISNYNGQDWPREVQDDFVQYMKNGGGLVVIHGADNSFPKWKEFNEMIALGGWGGRNEKDGPMVRWTDGKIVLDNSPHSAGGHGPQSEYLIEVRDPNHPITAGLPLKWMHSKDELYSFLRGPAKNITLLATSYADPAKKGSGKNEPVLFTISWEKGRIFHTVLGHGPDQHHDVGFIVTLQRGAEWASTGKVTQTKVPADFPTAEKSSQRAMSAK